MTDAAVSPNRQLIILFALIAASFYALAGIAFNPFIVWTPLPLYIAYIQFSVATETGLRWKRHAAIGYTLVSVGLSYAYHLAWFFDWHGTASGDAQSALIFVFFPVYAAVFGGVGYALGWVYARLTQGRSSATQ